MVLELRPRPRTSTPALGHSGTAWQEPDYRKHILGAIQWASGQVAGRLRRARATASRPTPPSTRSRSTTTPRTRWRSPSRPVGNVYYVELAGKVKYYNADTSSVRTVGTIPVHRGNENGLLGIALDPNFATNKWMYLFYSAPSPEEQHVSRFTVGSRQQLDMASEKVLLKIPHQRIVCCHSSGSIAFGPTGNLLISTGDDTEHPQSQGYNPIDDDVLRNNPGANADADRAYDARRTSGNTNDLRGKILRIKPEADGTYTIPAGQPVPAVGRPRKTKPEIYTMGHRNPFRISVDQETGWVYNGEVGPDAGTRTPTAARAATTSSTRSARRATWAGRTASPTTRPTATGRSRAAPPARRSTAPAARPTPRNYNTGLAKTPPATRALLWWPYAPYPAGFPWRRPTAIPTGSGRTAIAGPIYHFTPRPRPTRSSRQYYDDQVFFADWSRDWIATMRLTRRASPRRSARSCPTPTSGTRRTSRWARTARSTCSSGAATSTTPARASTPTPACTASTTSRARAPVAKASSDKDSGPSRR